MIPAVKHVSLNRRDFMATGAAVSAALALRGLSADPANALPATGPPIGPIYGYDDFDRAPLAQAPIFDDFDGPPGAPIDPALWMVTTINMGGNQIYTPGNANVYLDGASHCVIKLNNDNGAWYGGQFTSRTKFNMQYGTFATSMKCMPAQRRFGSAWWFLGCKEDGFPEIDVLQIQWSEVTEANVLAAFAARPNPNPQTAVYDRSPAMLPQLGGGGGSPRYAPTPDLTQDFHTFWMQKTPVEIVCGYDDVTCARWTAADVPPGFTWESLTLPQYTIYSAGFYEPPAQSGVGPASSNGPLYLFIDWFSYQPLQNGVAPPVPRR
jgi:hypothetical protein